MVYKPIVVSGSSLAVAWENAVAKMMTEGSDRRVDAPEYQCMTKDSPMFIIVEKPLAEPLIHEKAPLQKEMADEYAKNLIHGLPEEKAENEFDYTYFSRLRCYPDCEVRASVSSRSSDENLQEQVKQISDGKCIVKRIDQVKMAIDTLRKDPTRRSVVLHTWIPTRDLLKFGPKRDKSSSPCVVLVHPQLIEGKLHFFVTMKTNDLYNAWPLNAYGLVRLQEYMAKELGVSVGTYNHFSVSMQIYEDMYEMARELMKKD